MMIYIYCVLGVLGAAAVAGIVASVAMAERCDGQCEYRRAQDWWDRGYYFYSWLMCTAVAALIILAFHGLHVLVIGR